jgi:hypothetical protein
MQDVSASHAFGDRCEHISRKSAPEFVLDIEFKYFTLQLNRPLLAFSLQVLDGRPQSFDLLILLSDLKVDLVRISLAQGDLQLGALFVKLAL